jgi:dATP/dGTP diphosphohydrolase
MEDKAKAVVFNSITSIDWKGVFSAGFDRSNDLSEQIKIKIKEMDEAAKAKTYDEGKAPLAYLPWEGVKEVALVQAYGHAKYKDFNNFRKGMEIGRNLSCAIRHIAAYQEGQDLDLESGRNHLAHAACRLLFVLQNLHDGVAIDDRYKKPTT